LIEADTGVFNKLWDDDIPAGRLIGFMKSFTI
jgi:hypothetical protein